MLVLFDGLVDEVDKEELCMVYLVVDDLGMQFCVEWYCVDGKFGCQEGGLFVIVVFLIDVEILWSDDDE